MVFSGLFCLHFLFVHRFVVFDTTSCFCFFFSFLFFFSLARDAFRILSRNDFFLCSCPPKLMNFRFVVLIIMLSAIQKTQGAPFVNLTSKAHIDTRL